MIDISIYELHKYYGANHVLKGISLEINSGEKVGLLGRNGCGKTTLFKTITGEEYSDSGNISIASGKKAEMLAQIPIFGEGDTIEDILRSSFKEVSEIYAELKRVEGDETPSALARYGRLIEEYERLGGYDTDVKLDKVVNGMKISENMRNSLFKTLSGGEKTRVNLARILLRDSDILLLDEPTNHLDLSSLEWLEKFLCDFHGTVVVISHDRMFLDNVVTRIIEVDEGKAIFYSGNYSFYAEEKQRKFILQSEQYERQQKEIKRIEDRARWLVAQDRFTTKHHAILSRIDHMEKTDKPKTMRKLKSSFNSGGYASKEIVSLDLVKKSYGDKLILDGVSLFVNRNDSVAIVGANGCGKTTLLKMVMGEEQCDDGVIKVAPSVKCAYLPQIVEFDDDDATLLETLCQETEMSVAKARNVLGAFFFRADDVNKKVKVLSGGEKSRLKLCILMQTDVNFLLLDEPTNHLDIASREWIENVLFDFDGTMLFVSHDRYFLNKFADKVWCMEGGIITKFEYGFSEYLASTRLAESQRKPSKPIKSKDAKKPRSARVVSTDLLIAKVEAELEEVIAEIESSAPESDSPRLNSLYKKRQWLEKRIESLYEKWIEEA